MRTYEPKTPFTNQDKKYVKSHRIVKDGDETIYYIYFSLVTQNALNKILSFTSVNNGSLRLYPDNNLVCVEIKLKQ